MHALKETIQHLQKSSRKSVEQTKRKSVQQTNVGLLNRPTDGLFNRPSLTLLNTDLNTHKHSVCVHENLPPEAETFETLEQKSGLTTAQMKFILAKCQTTIVELAKAVKILQKSGKSQNLMKVLSTVAFFEGQCILAPDAEAEQERMHTKRADYLRQEGQRLMMAREQWERNITERRHTALENLRWYQDTLTDAQRATVRAHILKKHPSTQTGFRTGNFGPAILAFLGLARQELAL